MITFKVLILSIFGGTAVSLAALTPLNTSVGRAGQGWGEQDWEDGRGGLLGCGPPDLRGSRSGRL
jgi:hypothetical protein